MSLKLEPLVQHPQHHAMVADWFCSEWPDYYGPAGVGDAPADVQRYAQPANTAPYGLLALQDDQPCGFAALKTETFPSHPELGPWLGAAYVPPPLRRGGIGAALITGLEVAARQMGYPKLYCATATADSLMLRCHWTLLDTVQHQGHAIRVYFKPLSSRS